MTPRASLLAFLLTPVPAVAFVLLSAAPLPPVVAAHFAAGGAANGFMPRQGYVTLMAGLVAGLPLLLSLVSSTVRLVKLVEGLFIAFLEYQRPPIGT